jgi:hypothetical protein
MLNVAQTCLPLRPFVFWAITALPILGFAVETHPTASGKKGIGLSESRGRNAHDLTALRVHWCYNWGVQTQITTAVPFVPMAFSPKRIAGIADGSRWVLGFNEPDNSMQSSLPVQAALGAWPALVSKAQFIGAPAMAKNPLKTGNWLSAFMDKAPHVDFITVHWYKGVKPQLFIDDIKAICEAYKKPVWVTEFAPQTAADSRAQPEKFAQAEVDTFILDTAQWIEGSACVQPYARHDSAVGTSALFANGGLTATGRTYASAGAQK